METSDETDGGNTIDMLHGFLPRFPRWGFHDRGQERLFQSYARRIKWDAIDAIFVVGLVFDVHVILLHVIRFDVSHVPLLAVLVAATVVNSAMLVLFKKKFSFGSFNRFVPYAAWLLFMAHFYLVLLSGREILILSSLVEWQLVSIYFVLTVMPVQKGTYCVLIVTSCALHGYISTFDYVDATIFKIANMVRRVGCVNMFD